MISDDNFARNKGNGRRLRHLEQSFKVDFVEKVSISSGCTIHLPLQSPSSPGPIATLLQLEECGFPAISQRTTLHCKISPTLGGDASYFTEVMTSSLGFTLTLPESHNKNCSSFNLLTKIL